MSLLELGPTLFGGSAGIITYLQGQHVLASSKQFPCGTAMVLQDWADISDGCRWRCPNCQKTFSIRDGSFFQQSQLPLQKWLLLIYWWARQYPVTDAQEEAAQVTNTTAIQVKFQNSCTPNISATLSSVDRSMTSLWACLLGIGDRELDKYVAQLLV